MLSEFDHVEMRRRANAVDEDQLVLRTVERAHASVRLVPEAQIQEVAIDPLADGRDVVHVPPIHTDEVHGAIARDASASAKGFGKKSPESLVRHLTGSHRELAVAPFRVRVAADPNVVRWIQEGRIDRSIIANDLAKEVEVATIAATNAVLATNPDIAGMCAGLKRNGRNRLVVRIALRRQQHVDLAGRKPSERKVEIDLEVSKLLKLQLQKISIPAGVERNLIIGKAQRASLRLVEMRQRNGRRQVEANRLGR